MSPEKNRNHRVKAEGLRADEQYVEAGEYFSTAAYARLGESPPTGYGKNLSRALRHPLSASICYRLGGKHAQYKNRCKEGIMLSEEMKDRLNTCLRENPYDQARRGAWDEFIGDFKIILESQEYLESYNAAKNIYKSIEDFDLGFAEQEHLELIRFCEDMLRASESGIEH